MALRNLVLEGDALLRKKSREVTKVDDRICTILDDMLETMREYDGVGLAAVQVGILRRMFVVEWEDKVYELINPEILEKEGSILEEEGCLSLPGLVGTVKRPARVKITGFDRKGNRVEYDGEGMLAKAFCHEYDHLDGVLYTDLADEMWEVGKKEGAAGDE